MVMARFAEHECDDCGVVLPSSQLHRITDRILSSVSRSTRLYRSVGGGVGGGGSSRQSFKVVKLEVCDDCYQDRVARARRARFWRTVGWLLMVGVVAIVVFGLSNAPKHDAPRSEVTNSPAREADATSTTSDPAPPTADPSPARMAEPESTPPQVADDLTEPAAGRSGVWDQAIATATSEALDEGRAVPWKGGGGKGFVTVSDPQTYADRTCRNAYATIDARGGHERTPDVTWCRSAEGEGWTIQR